MSDLQEKIISLKIQCSATTPKSCSTKERETDNSDFVNIKNAATIFSETVKYAKINYSLGKFVGNFFYWEKVGQDLLLVNLCGRNSCQYGEW